MWIVTTEGVIHSNRITAVMHPISKKHQTMDIFYGSGSKARARRDDVLNLIGMTDQSIREKANALIAAIEDDAELYPD
jgi:hypothetical protein